MDIPTTIFYFDVTYGRKGFAHEARRVSTQAETREIARKQIIAELKRDKQNISKLEPSVN